MSSSTTDIPKTMLAFQLTANHPEGAVLEVPVPTPGAEQALIRVLRAGVCNTDLEILKGYMGFQGTLGHEFVGEAVEFGSNVTPELRERLHHRRVVGDINLACASCSICLSQTDRSRNHCPNRTVLGILNQNGTFAEYLVLPVSNLHVVDDDGMSNAVAVFCEPLAAAFRIVEQNLLRPGDRALILGDGKLGLMIAEALGRHQEEQSAPHKPILVGKHRHKLDLVQNAGVECRLLSDISSTTSTLDDGSAAPAARQVLPEYLHQFDVVVDATGSPAGLNMAVRLCRPMGTLVLKSTCAASSEQFQAAPIVIDELRIVGSRCGPFPPALKLLAAKPEEGGLRVEKYITKTFSLKDAVQAIQCAAEKSTMKVQLICCEGA